MKKTQRHLAFSEHTIFHSFPYGALSFSQLFEKILHFIHEDADAKYVLSVGSDSQTSAKHTMFVTCIIIHRVGKGALGFYTRQRLDRSIQNLREKLSMETTSSLQVTYMFDEDRITRIYDILLHGMGDVEFEFHIDIGENGPTRAYISEMIAMARGLYFIPRIKPDAYCASTYADKHSKSV